MNIAYPQVEELLKRYTTLKASWKAWYLEYMKEIARLKSDPDNSFTAEEILYTQFIGNHILSDMPHGSPSPGNKLLNTILAKDKIVDESIDQKISNTLKGLKQPLDIVGNVIVRLDFAMERLSTQERSVVEMKYFNDMTWREIAANCDAGKTAVQAIRRQAVDKIVTQLQDPKAFVTIKDYDFCMEQLAWEEKKQKEA